MPSSERIGRRSSSLVTESVLILATSAMRLAAAWLAYRLYRGGRELRFAIVAFVLAVTAAFPLVERLDSASYFPRAGLREVGAGLAVLLTALILVRTLTDLSRAYEELRGAHDRLEQRVVERTAQLRLANETLRSEVVERRKAEQALRASEIQLRDLAAKLIAAQEDERRRLARELHDDLSQSLAAMALEIGKLRLQAAASEAPIREGLARAEDSVHRLADDIHDLSRLLHPSILDDLGLAAAVRAECERFSEREQIAVRRQIEDPPPDVSGDVALTLYRVTQEALHNVAKHSAARSARVSLRTEGDRVVLEIEDDGVGFEPESARRAPGLGLISMGERARGVGAELKVEAGPGRGSRIRVEAPPRSVRA